MFAINDTVTAPETPVQPAACITQHGNQSGSSQFGIAVVFQSVAGVSSGYHDHSALRPQGHFDNAPIYPSYAGGPNVVTKYTAPDGCAYVTWYAPQASGTYDVLATSNAGSAAHFILVWTLHGQNALFLEIASRNGAAAGGPILNEGNHYHLRFGN